MKNVLITNLFFEKYTGSELHVLEIARLFEEKGFEVTIAVFQKAYPLMAEAGSIRIVECQSEELGDTDFDVLFVQHFPVFDYICCKYNIQYKYLIVSKLSVFMDVEQLPICTNDADMIWCISQECADCVKKSLGLDNRIRILKNCASDDFFEKYNINYNKRYHLKRIAVISNHVPEEIIELKELMKNEYEIEFIGMEYNPYHVTAELLGEYDLIITIGRTVQACFAAGVPVYVYDYFGGPGYIDSSNFELAERNNFSGRGFLKKTVSELFEDIIDQYDQNIGRLAWLHNIAAEEYCYSRTFDKLYGTILSGIRMTKTAEYYVGLEKERVFSYATRLIDTIRSRNNQVSKLYLTIRSDSDGSEKSISWNAVGKYVIQKLCEWDGYVEEVSFEPCNASCISNVYDIFINGESRKEWMEAVNVSQNVSGGANVYCFQTTVCY